MTFDREMAAGYIDAMYSGVPGRLSVTAAFAGEAGMRHLDGTVEKVLDWAEKMDNSGAKGVYLRATTLVAPVEMRCVPGGRGGAKDSRALNYLWADLDYGTEGHKHNPAQYGGRVAPPDEGSALKMIADLPAPSVLVHSGGGLYPLWVLDRPVLFDDDAARDEAGKISAGLQNVIAETAARHGWHYGTGVGDLARVLRLPGTANRKVADRDRLCRVLQQTGEVHRWEDLAEIVRRAEYAAKKPAKAETASRAENSIWDQLAPPSVFDEFARTHSWADILEPVGWTAVNLSDAAEGWRRPGASSAVSAKVLRENEHVLVVHSTDAGLPAGAGQKLTKARVYAHLHHGGDESAAARALLDRATPAAKVTSPPGDATGSSTGEESSEAGQLGRRLRLTRADEIEPEPVIWAWQEGDAGRIPSGSMSVAAGREGTGKSSFGIWMAAQITKGTLPGSFHGQPREVFYVAVEDSWKYTLVPRLIAAGADLSKAHRVEVIEDEDTEVSLSLPIDNRLLEQGILDNDVALVVIDPLMSVIGDKIDTHREREVRSALDPLAKLADRTGSVLLGIAHFNKGAGTDAASLITGSGAFKNVPRSVFGFARDESDDTGGRIMSQVKNSLGRDDLPSLGYRIESVDIPTKKGTATTGAFTFTGETDRSVADVLRDSRGGEDEREERNEAAAWLVDYLTSNGGSCSAGDALKAAAANGISKTTLTRARKSAGVRSAKAGMNNGWEWTLEESTKRPKNPESRTLDPSVPSVDSSETVAGAAVPTEAETKLDFNDLIAESAPLDERPRCSNCKRAMGKADTRHGTCIQCRRIAAANGKAA